MEELARKLSEAFGVSGFEEQVRAAIQEEIAGCADESRVDVMGNLIAVRYASQSSNQAASGEADEGSSRPKRVMLAAHMDQIGVIITHVDEKGFLRFAPLGGVFPLACWGAQVRFADGTIGTIGLDGRVDRRGNVPELRDMYVDTGARSRDDVTLKVGDVGQFWPGFASQGNAWFSPNLDDRAGCIALAQLLKDLRGQDVANDIYAVFTTQEEVGTRGAATSAFAIEPDIAIALDVTLTGDTPYARPAMDMALGRGVAIKVKDSGMIGHPGLNRLLASIAEAEGIPYQMEVLAGGTTDAFAMQVSRSGVPATALSFPSRHVHTPSQIVDRRDVEACIKLLRAMLTREIPL